MRRINKPSIQIFFLESLIMIIFQLTGGLGNQLFQLAAALFESKNQKVYFDKYLGKPRGSISGKIEIENFNLPNDINILQRPNYSWFFSKVNGYILRKGIHPRSYEKFSVVSQLVDFIASFLNTIRYRKKLIIQGASNVGYCEFEKSSISAIRVGYFQSFKWANDEFVKSKLKAIRILNLSSELEEYRNLAITELPLVVHVRLGDYKSEDSFGIVAHNYYEVAIDKLWKSGKYKKIWLFSDEPHTAIEFMPIWSKDFVRIVDEIEGSPSKTLEVMRFGLGYVIANSSFSWWGAFLSYNEDAEVVAPIPWFSGQNEPQFLIPQNWNRVGR